MGLDRSFSLSHSFDAAPERSFEIFGLTGCKDFAPTALLEKRGRVDRGRILGHNRFMEVTLSKELESFVAEKVRTGGYANADEVVREALRNLRAKDDPAEVDSQELAGVDDADFFESSKDQQIRVACHQIRATPIE
jgi:putative addiction module CopG family antidote